MNTPSPKIAVCGAGTMGSGIAQICAQHGMEVTLFDIDANRLKASHETISNSLLQLARKKSIPDDEGMTPLQHIRFSTNINDCVADVIIEAIVEDADAKASLMNRLAEINSPATVLATNTSSISITSIAKKISRPAQLVGMHFFNPAPLMKLVEIVHTEYSCAAAISSVTTLATALGKTPVRCTDSPGFIVNRIARPYYLEALWLLEYQHADMTSIDELMEASGFRMGPFKLMDLIGNDINFAVSNIVYDSLQKPERLKPSGIQEQKVKDGLLGRKTGKGYYEYPTK